MMLSCATFSRTHLRLLLLRLHALRLAGLLPRLLLPCNLRVLLCVRVS
jgi:hypothetical protein